MDSLADFVAMGGYAEFVWPAFGLTALVLVGLLVGSFRTLKANESALTALERTSTESDREA